ncbi:MAG TPA: GGDEF domain-containing protein [Gammaproteobacteria bacterium]|nr:GGDEF domain-containing protein [Gammaproteobacteria bacterium]
MGATYVFVGVAFIIGLLCASIYHRIRQRFKQRANPQSAQTLTALIGRLDRIQQPDDLGAALLEELGERLHCKALALYLRDDVEFRLRATRGFEPEDAETLRQQLDADAALAAPSQTARVVRLKDGAASYALVAITDHRQTAVVALHPPKVISRDAAKRLVEAAAGYALARLEAMRLGDALKEAATQDAVTRLHNQRYFLELFELEYNRSLRYQRSLAVLLCGVDGLATVNTREGSEAGDAVLRQVANAFRGSLRYFDVVGRYEADTLAVLLPEADRVVAARVAERLLHASGAETGIDNLAMNIGVACNGDPGADFMTMLHAASDALRNAREGSGNRVCMSPD